jgi:hypothetical protein
MRPGGRTTGVEVSGARAARLLGASGAIIGLRIL